MIDSAFQKRFWGNEQLRPDDERDEYKRDKARVIHSSSFRRLQAKTQVMGVGEGDFHRTRLTHSIEVAEVGEGLLDTLKRDYKDDRQVDDWLPSRDLLIAACLAHDLGHPPFGHGGEKALHSRMINTGGFEGNGQTLRIVSRLEKYKLGQGMNPTRRFVLAILKYPSPYSTFDRDKYRDKPPKCYYDSEKEIVQWALGEPFSPADAHRFATDRSSDGKPKHRTFDCAIMECADDIAYGVHDLEDIAARHMVSSKDVTERLQEVFSKYGPKIGCGEKAVSLTEFGKDLFADSFRRKQLIGKLVNLFITSVAVRCESEFQHPLLRMRVGFEEPIGALLEELKNLTYDLVVRRAEVQQLERRGQRVIDQLYDELMRSPKELIPTTTWDNFAQGDTDERKVCDYIAGMTDTYAEKVYGRLFVPGEGSSRDEL